MSLSAVPGSIQQKVLVTKLLSLSLAAGLLLFLGLQLFMFRDAAPASTGGQAVMMTTLAAAGWAVCLVIGFVMYQRLASPLALARHVAGRDDEAALHAIHQPLQVACLMRWALLEGPGLFAAVVLFMNSQDVRGQPVLLVDIVIVLLSATLILLTAPTEATMRELVRVARRAAPHRPR